jgi:hypothetical protein
MVPAMRGTNRTNQSAIVRPVSAAKIAVSLRSTRPLFTTLVGATHSCHVRTKIAA